MLRWRELKVKKVFATIKDKLPKANSVYLITSVMISVVFLTIFFIYGVTVIGIKPYDFFGMVASGIIVALIVASSPYLIANIKKKKTKRTRKKKKDYPICLLTNNPPGVDAKKLKIQSERIDFIIKDLNKICSECLSKKCSRCRINREIIPALKKIEKKLRE